MTILVAILLSLMNFVVHLIYVNTIGAFHLVVSLMGWKFYAFQSTIQVGMGIVLFYYLPTFTIVTSAASLVYITGHLIYFKVKQPKVKFLGD